MVSDSYSGLSEPCATDHGNYWTAPGHWLPTLVSIFQLGEKVVRVIKSPNICISAGNGSDCLTIKGVRHFSWCSTKMLNQNPWI